MRILVTGGAGFIGRRVVEAMVAAGEQVTVLDALLPEVHPAQQPPLLPDGVEFIRGDVRDDETVTAALRGVDLVSHQAAVVGRGREILDAAHHVGCNDLGTATLLAAMTRAGLGRLVLASSVAVYGDGRYDCPRHGRVRAAARAAADLAAGRFDRPCPDCGASLAMVPLAEDDPCNPPPNVYYITKLAQELLVGAWARETGGRAAVLRYHHVYGPDMAYASPYSGVAATFRSAVEGGLPPRVFEDGRPLRDFVHVSDVAAANLAATHWDGTGARAFNVASGRPRSIGDLAAAIAAAADGPAPVVTGEYRLGDVRHIVASPQRLMQELGWRPAVDFETGIKEFVLAPMRGAPDGAAGGPRATPGAPVPGTGAPS
jgi:dTDP-L-rhamnose 4-epimerase